MWRVELSRDSKKFLRKLQKKVISAIFSKIENFKMWLEGKVPLVADVKKLKGNWEGFYRIRIGVLELLLAWIPIGRLSEFTTLDIEEILRIEQL